MFTMMNHMRLGVGLHSLGLAERSLQLARDYARERLQGRDAAGAQRPIIEHADVRRMLLTMKSLTQAARGLAYTAAATLDVAHSAPNKNQRAAANRHADLLTPIVKAWCSDVAVEVASLGVQIHGGMGFVDDAEISQVYRDARIGPIFEGTNYIQAQDLLGRKVIRDNAAVLGELLVEIEKAAEMLPDPPMAGPTGAAVTNAPVSRAATTGTPAQPAVPSTPLSHLRSGLLDGCARLRAATTELIANSAQQPDLVGATAHHFLQWLGVLAGGWQLALAATRAAAESDTGTARATADMAAFYATHILPRALAHEATVRNGVGSVATASMADL
jgi:3-(methylthio)propanoyl-CoA dehydrogenase